MGDVQEELNLALSMKILSMAVLEEFWILVVYNHHTIQTKRSWDIYFS
jgi:hypothetical protein